MIKNFEEYTYDLTEFEKQSLLPRVISILENKIGSVNAVSNKKIVNILSTKGIIVSEARVRKIINTVRTKCLLPCLIANSTGYYIAETTKELNDYINSLEERGVSILSVARALKTQRPFEQNLFN